VQNTPRNALTSEIVNPVSNFQFDDHPVRVVTRNGEPWFVAADVCAALTIGNPTDALKRLDSDEQALDSIEGLTRGNDNVNLVSESGMFSLTLGSRKPEARRFKKWVTSEVLPSIRKTGFYGTLSNPIMNMIVQQAIQYDKLEQEQQRLASQLQMATKLISSTSEKVDRVAAIVDATDPQYYTIKAYANIVGTRVDDKVASRLGKLAVRLSTDAGVDVGKARDGVYGLINRYHESILEQVFETL